MVYVDFPICDKSEGRWEEIRTFDTKDEAIKWLKHVLGEHAVDDDGRVCLITIGKEASDGQNNAIAKRGDASVRATGE